MVSVPDSLTRVVVAVPVYRKDITGAELVSLRQTCRVLQSRKIVVVHPQGLDVSGLAELFPQLEFESFPPYFFKGIKGYNRLMTSPDFYERFSSWQYILIAQLDTYLFRDDLDSWCSRNFDYVGAPWLKRPVNSIFSVSLIKRIKDWCRKRKGLYSKISIYDKVGNGGLSLRRVESHLGFVKGNQETLLELNGIGEKGTPEDVIFATLPESFSYPSSREALEFAFDKYPRYSYRLMNGRLPMGCHGWTSRKMRRFWKKFIPQE